jgi:hypothetical protein
MKRDSIAAGVLGSAFGSTPPLLPYYHCVTDQAPVFLSDVISPRKYADFRRDVAVFRRMAASHGFMNRRPTLSIPTGEPAGIYLCFDDGLREGLHRVYSLIREQGLRLILFVCPAFIGNTDLMFRHKAGLLIAMLAEPSVTMDRRLRIHDMLASEGIVASTLTRSILAVPYQRRSMLDDAARILGVDISRYAMRTAPYLNAGELRALAAEGVCIASHGMDHAPVAGENPDDCINAVNESFERFHTSGIRYERMFSYPFGDAGIPEAMIDLVLQRCELEFSFGTAGWRPDRNPQHLQRLRMELPCSGAGIITRELLRNCARRVSGRLHPSRTPALPGAHPASR